MLVDEYELLDKLNNIDPKSGLELINENEGLIVKTYYKVTQYKITFLLKLNKYIDAKIIVANELNAPYIPLDFEKFLKESEKIIDDNLNNHTIDPTTYLENLDKFDDDTLFSILPRLKSCNLNDNLDAISKIFVNENIKPLTKSIMIAILSDQHIDKTFVLSKCGYTLKFNPIKVIDLRETKAFIYLKKSLNEITECEHNLLTSMESIVANYLLYYYPIEIEIEKMDALIATAYLMLKEMLKSTSFIAKYERYNNSDEVINYRHEIEKILES